MEVMIHELAQTDQSRGVKVGARRRHWIQPPCVAQNVWRKPGAARLELAQE